MEQPAESEKSNKTVQTPGEPGGFSEVYHGWQTLGMSLTLALLYTVGVAAPRLPSWAVIALYCLVWGGTASVLFWYARQRRSIAVLAHIKDETRLKQWLKGGIVMLFVSMLSSAVIALGLLLALVNGIGSIAWVGLVICVLVWVGFGPRIDRSVQRRFASHAVPYFAARSRLWLMTSGLVVALLITNFWMPVTDFSESCWREAYQYGHAQADSRSELLHTLSAIWSGADSMNYWVAEQWAESSNNFWTTAFVWGVTLLKKVLVVLPALLLVQGASLVSKGIGHRMNRVSDRNGVLVWAARGGAIVALSVLVLLVWSETAPSPWGWLTEDHVLVEVQGKTFWPTRDEFDKAVKASTDNLSRARQKAISTLNTKIEARVDEVFDAAVERVPGYVDWYYSPKGELIRKVAWARSLVGGEEPSGAMKRLFPNEGLKNQLEDLNDEYGDRFRKVQDRIQQSFISRFVGALEPYATAVKPCEEQDVAKLELEDIYSEYLASETGLQSARKHTLVSLATGGAAAGVAGVTMAKQIGKSAVETTSKTGGRMSVRLVGKWAARLGTKALGAGAVCVATGPAVFVCSAGVFAVTELVTEYAFLTMDEQLDAEEKEKQLVNKLNRLRQKVIQEYQRQSSKMLVANWNDLGDRVRGQIRPADTLDSDASGK